MARHDRVCFKCKKNRATYSFQGAQGRQLRTQPGLCVHCVFNRSNWNCPVKVLTNPEECKTIKPNHFINTLLLYRNPKAVAEEMKEILSWPVKTFNEYIVDISCDCGFSAVVNHFFFTRRKIRLFFIASLRFMEKYVSPEMFDFLNQAEDFADYSEIQVDEARNSIERVYSEIHYSNETSQYKRMLDHLVVSLFNYGSINYSSGQYPICMLNTAHLTLKYLFHVFGDEDMKIDKKFITFDVLALAKKAYYDRDWSAMPILADALQDAGFDNNKVMKQCQEGYHYRGCKILDSILNKT